MWIDPAGAVAALFFSFSISTAFCVCHLPDHDRVALVLAAVRERDVIIVVEEPPRQRDKTLPDDEDVIHIRMEIARIWKFDTLLDAYPVADHPPGRHISRQLPVLSAPA